MSTKIVVYETNNRNKEQFIKFRIMRASEEEARFLVDISDRTLQHWKLHDEEFAYWNGTGLEKAQQQRSEIIGDVALQIGHIYYTDIYTNLIKIVSKPLEKRTKLERQYYDKHLAIVGSPTALKAVTEFLKTGEIEEDEGFWETVEERRTIHKKLRRKELVIEGEFNEMPQLQAANDSDEGSSGEAPLEV